MAHGLPKCPQKVILCQQDAVSCVPALPSKRCGLPPNHGNSTWVSKEFGNTKKSEKEVSVNQISIVCPSRAQPHGFMVLASGCLSCRSDHGHL